MNLTLVQMLNALDSAHEGELDARIMFDRGAAKEGFVQAARDLYQARMDVLRAELKRRDAEDAMSADMRRSV